MIDLFAQHERLMIKSRTKAALAAKARRGERTGQIPYGFTLATNGVALIVNEAEQAVIAQIQALRTAGHSLREIAQELNRQSIPTQKGQPWNHNTIDSILKRQAA
jgi:DNA invertase Pin-like site-specific DNA recombinase